MAILAECPICHRKQSIKNKKCSCGVDMDSGLRLGTIRGSLCAVGTDGQLWAATGIVWIPHRSMAHLVTRRPLRHERECLSDDYEFIRR